MCHLILLMPVLALPVFWFLPLPQALLIYLVILLLSAWIYYYIIIAMRREVIVGPETLLHSHGKVVGVADGILRVRVQSENWNATSTEKLKKDETIEVLSVDGLTLRVRKV